MALSSSRFPIIRRRAGVGAHLFLAVLLGPAITACEPSDGTMISEVVRQDGAQSSGFDAALGGQGPLGGNAADASFSADASGLDAGGSPGGNNPPAIMSDAALDGGHAGQDGAPDASGGDAGTAADGGAQPAATCPPTPTLRPGDTTRTVQVGGVARTFILHVPSGYMGKSPVPLVIDWHPIFGTGAGERSGSGYVQLSDTEGFVVAFPNGIDNAWNVGPCCTLSRSVDDVGFARAIVKDIQSQACIDAKRIYTTGFSMGGGMSHYLACNAADLFAAAVPAAFDLLAEEEQPCKPARPITVMSFRGTSDFVVPYEGGASAPPNGLPTIHFRGALATFEHWKALNGCTGAPTMKDGCQTYASCRDGVETTLCTIRGGGHSYGDANLGWATMKRHSLP
jgi:polyhydroxybutyrate depolymerase